MQSRFRDRREAGRVLAAKLARYHHRSDALVLALPRGGVPVGYEVARALDAPLEVFLARKLGLPSQPEVAIGAVASGGLLVLNHSIIRALGIPAEALGPVIARERLELERRERAYRSSRPPPSLRGRCVILVDDGLATGATMFATVQALRKQKPARVVVAVPIAPPDVCEELHTVADDVVCALTPEPFVAVGEWYEDFSETTDEEVQELLARGTAPLGANPG